MSTLFKTKTPVTGFRYYFSLLVGISRGPIDELILIKSADAVAWDGAQLNEITSYTSDPLAIPFDDGSTGVGPASSGLGSWPGGSITDNAYDVPLNKPNLYGGDEREGGMVGNFDVYMGAPTQTLGSRIQRLMAGLRLSNMRGVTTMFYDGEVCANNPYPKAMKFRVRRAIKGWDGDCWYPEKAKIVLTDPAIPSYNQSIGTFNTTVTLNNGSDFTNTVTNKDGTQEFNSYTTGGGIANVTAVPQVYNRIVAMNPAHIIYECCTNRDWGRGLSRTLMDEISFTASANQLYDEGFGLCMKWSRSDEIDTFLQTVLDHIAGALYTDRLTGLLCLRLIRSDYVESTLPVFGYNTGLLSVSMTENASQDANPNEVIVKYNSPVLDGDKQARAQNIASISALGAIYSVTKQYPGIPISTLAVLVAQRDLKATSSGMKRMTVKLDRRAYRLVPGDVIKINAPEEGLTDTIMRIATVEDSEISDGTITIGGAQDVFGQPTIPFNQEPMSTFQEPNLFPYPITNQSVSEATYRDVYKAQGQAFVDALPNDAGFVVMTAQAPTMAAYAFSVRSTLHHAFSTLVDPPTIAGNSRFAQVGTLINPIGVTDTVFQIRGQPSGTLNPRTATIGSALTITSPYETSFTQEFVRLDAITESTDGTVVTLTVGRGCLDTPALPHAAGHSVWSYDDTGAGDVTQYTYNDIIGMQGLTKTSRGILPADRAPNFYQGLNARVMKVYSGSDFRLNGYARDAVPVIGPDIEFTWKHRNKLTQADTLIDETMGSVTAETGTIYSVYVFGTGGFYTGLTSNPALTGGFTGTSRTFTGAMADSVGIGDGPMRIIFQTYIYGVPLTRAQSYRQVVVDIIYTRTLGGTGGVVVYVPPSTGWGSDFGNSFGV